jgi:hypothetical protein
MEVSVDDSFIPDILLLGGRVGNRYFEKTIFDNDTDTQSFFYFRLSADNA